MFPGTADDLQQAHIARRVEEMRDAEIAREGFRQTGSEFFQRNCRGVGGDDGARLAHGVELFVEVLLDVEAFDHGLDDPVGIFQIVEIILDIAGFDQADGAAAHERRRVHFFQAFNGAFGNRIAVCGTGFDDVQQQHMRAGIGGMGGDARPHDARADHGDGTDFTHLKWPPEPWRCPGRRQCIAWRARSGRRCASAAQPPCR